MFPPVLVLVLLSCCLSSFDSGGFSPWTIPGARSSITLLPEAGIILVVIFSFASCVLSSRLLVSLCSIDSVRSAAVLLPAVSMFPAVLVGCFIPGRSLSRVGSLTTLTPDTGKTEVTISLFATCASASGSLVLLCRIALVTFAPTATSAIVLLPVWMLPVVSMGCFTPWSISGGEVNGKAVSFKLGTMPADVAKIVSALSMLFLNGNSLRMELEVWVAFPTSLSKSGLCILTNKEVSHAWETYINRLVGSC